MVILLPQIMPPARYCPQICPQNRLFLVALFYWMLRTFLTAVDMKMIFSHTRHAPAKSGVGIGVPESAERITAPSGFFMR
ncbi:hypothetical protein EKO14_06625 [Enterobacter bugandensis]|nr:hypothetical protein EKO14_06625 [Enterobacter bugandensis]